MMHRCTGCPSCLRTIVAYVPAWDPPIAVRDTPNVKGIVEHQLQDLLDGTPNDWYGGREMTQGRDLSIEGCTHRRYTKYKMQHGDGTFDYKYFCRLCGRWFDDEPMVPA